jgi:hypothetical protein
MTHASRSTSSLFASAVLAAGLSACGEAGSPQTDAEYDDVAFVVSGLVADEGGDLEAMEDMADLALGERKFDFTQTSSGTFVRERGRLTYTYDIECTNARGQVIDPCDARTQRAEISVRIVGNFATARRTGSLVRTGGWTLVRDGATFTIDGRFQVDRSSTFAALHRDETRNYVMTASGRAIGVELDLGSKQFVAGTLRYQLSADRARSTRFDDIVASFDVDAEVELTPEGPLVIRLDKERTYRSTRDGRRVGRSAE